MRIEIATLFPEMCETVLSESIVGRARKKGLIELKCRNIRDYTDLLHLVILNNLENINATLIQMSIPQSKRLIKLNELARKQLELLYNSNSLKELNYK